MGQHGPLDGHLACRPRYHHQQVRVAALIDVVVKAGGFSVLRVLAQILARNEALRRYSLSGLSGCIVPLHIELLQVNYVTVLEVSYFCNSRHCILIVFCNDILIRY